MIEIILTNFSLIFTFTLFVLWPKLHNDKNNIINRLSKTQYNTLIGIIIGIIGILFGFVALDYFEGVLYNARIILILFSGMVGGPIAVIISGLIMNVGRLLLFPTTDLSLMLSLNAIVLLFFIAYFARKYGIHYKNIHIFLYFSLFEIGIVMLFYFDFSFYGVKFITFFTSFTIATFWAIYWVVYQSQLTSDQARESMALKQIDYLTQLPNNYAIEAYLKNTIQHSGVFSLLYIDIDRFKQYNNQYSYLIGDSILQELATIMKRYAKGKDVFIGRIGGQEFCYVLNNSVPAIAIHEANSLREIVEEHTFGQEHGLELKITISIGISSSPDNGITTEQLFVNADKALQASKKTRFNHVYHYNQYLKDIEYSHL